MISDVPLGCFLSGGVDSSAVVALMSRFSDKPVRTFSIGFTDDAFNELPYARAVAEHLDTEHHEFTVRPEAAAVLPDIVRHLGEPFGDASAVPTWYVAQLARQHVTVALSGDGGDELFGGYPWYQTGLALDRAARSLPRWAAAPVTRGAAWLGPRAGRLGRRLSMPPGERFASLRRTLDCEVRARLYSPTLLVACGSEAERYLPQHYEAATGDLLARMQATDVATYLPEDLLVKVDRMTSAHSLEGRSPFLDHELLELCVRIPARHKVGRGGGKLLLREAMRPLFPPGLLDRPKMGFSVPVAQWLSGDLREDCRRALSSAALLERGWFEPIALRSLVDALTRSAETPPLVWNLLILEAWAREYLS
jgi:asparagine synthase (glutamine-hydrolysing)